MDICPNCGHREEEENKECDLFSSDFPAHLSEQGKVDYSNIMCVLNWAKTQKDFNTDFFESLKSSLDKFKHLSDKQRASLNNVVRKFRIK